MKYLDPKADLTFKKIFGNHPARDFGEKFRKRVYMPFFIPAYRPFFVVL